MRHFAVCQEWASSHCHDGIPDAQKFFFGQTCNLNKVFLLDKLVTSNISCSFAFYHKVNAVSLKKFYKAALSGKNRSCKENTGDGSGQDGQESAFDGIAGLGDFGRQKIDTHGIEQSFRAAHKNRGHKPGIGIRTVIFEDVQNQTGSGGGGKQFDDQKWKKAGRK